ncbi:MAG: penicillin-insensitive murein endopeptidase [Myxococcota bacterium]
MRVLRGVAGGAVVAFVAGCAGFVPHGEGTVSFGAVNDGVLRGGVALPDEGEGYVRARPGESTRFGTPGLVGTVVRAAERVRRSHPGGAPLRVGDLSAPAGGKHSRHASHRTGRDVDLLFYAHDAEGRPLRATGFLRFDRFGVARVPAGLPGAGKLAFFDHARNWALVRALLTDPRAPVQWILCSDGVKAQLLQYAAVHEPSFEVLFRAAWVLHEPRGARRHDDHFHVRVACTAEQRSQGCRDRAPIWPWIRKAVEKPGGTAGAAHTDAGLVEALLEPIRPNSARSRVATAAP